MRHREVQVNDKSNLDHGTVRILRTSLGMSQSRLALALGVSPTIVRDIELGRNLNQLRLGFLGRLADVLEVDLRDIMRREHDAVDPTEDDIRVESLLSSESSPLSAQEIAATFGWTLSRTREALRQLRARLACGGQRLRETDHNRWRIAPHLSIISTDDRERQATMRLRKKGLTTTEALLLRKVASGLIDQNWGKDAKKHETQAIGALLGMGLVTTDLSGATIVEPTIEASLHLTRGATRRTGRSSPRKAGVGTDLNQDAIAA